MVAAKLTEVSAELLTGICSKPKNKDVAREIKDKPSLLSFSGHLEQYLALSAVEASNLICSYLMYEYKGSATSLLNCLSTDQQRHKLLVDIAKYHSLERFVLLKIVRNLLEQAAVKNHPYHEEYATIVATLQVAALRKSYIQQLVHLAKDQRPVAPQHGEFLAGATKEASWTERKMHEMVEVLQIVLLCVEQDGVRVDELGQLVELFRTHSFGRQQGGLDGSHAGHVDLINKLAYSEVALFLKCLDVGNCV